MENKCEPKLDTKIEKVAWHWDLQDNLTVTLRGVKRWRCENEPCPEAAYRNLNYRNLNGIN